MVGFLCTACGKSFTQKVALRKHFYAIHKEDTCVCKECGKVLKSKSKLTNHLHSHEKITCSVCNKLIPKNSRASHDCGNFETFKCDQCPYGTKQKAHLMRHIKVHDKAPKEKELFTCYHCVKTFNRKDNMEAHVKILL